MAHPQSSMFQWIKFSSTMGTARGLLPPHEPESLLLAEDDDES